MSKIVREEVVVVGLPSGERRGVKRGMEGGIGKDYAEGN